jgi:hypothetical protein
MADYTAAWTPLITITPGSFESLGAASGRILIGAANSQAFTTANRIFYVPFRLHSPALAVKMSYVVGATSSGNVDVGIYDWQKNRLVNSGSTAQGSTSTIQTLDITDTALTPGRYFMAIAGSSGTGTFLGRAANDELIFPVVSPYEETPGSFGLPTTAAFAPSTAATPLVPAMCVHFDTLV